MTEYPRIAIGFIGAGRLGSSLAGAIQEAGYQVRAIGSANSLSAATLAEALGPEVEPTADPERVLAVCDLIFLTVPDAAIEPLSRSLRWEPRHLVVHCSGALGLEKLGGVVAAGATAGCFHPLQSFPSRSPDPTRFTGIFCGVEGDDRLGPLLERLAGDLGARAFRLEGVDRALYHAAAVVASNHVVALASAASRLLTIAGLPEGLGREALAPLLLASAENVSRLELASALTGPIARGDVATVEAHLGALAGQPALRELYRLLSAELLNLPLNHDQHVLERLRTTLEERA